MQKPVALKCTFCQRKLGNVTKDGAAFEALDGTTLHTSANIRCENCGNFRRFNKVRPPEEEETTTPPPPKPAA